MNKPYNFRKRMIAATPMICVIVFLLLGFLGDLWHPGWLVFLLIPLMPFLLGYKKLHITYPLVCGIAYLIMGIGMNLWHPGWIIFLTIPVFDIFFRGIKHNDKKDNGKKTVIDIEE